MLFGCWEEKTIDVEATPSSKTSSPPVEPTIVMVENRDEPLLKAKEVLALPPSSLEQASRRRNKQVLIASAIISIVVSFITVAALTRWLIKRDIAAALSEPAKTTAAAAASETGGANAQTIKVAMRVENGRVLQAFVEDHRPGMEAYEALALRLARGRRYAATATGQETVIIKINSPD